MILGSFFRRNKKTTEKPAEKKQLSALEEKIFNEGERLIPGVTHDLREVIRHRSSYEFFRLIIKKDSAGSRRKTVKIADLGCGVGHGCKTLSSLKGTLVTGLDCSEECVAYANKNYKEKNVSYKVADLVKYIRSMPRFDYIVSRGVLEHIPNGLSLAARSNRSSRLIFDVPYMEGEGNKFHLIRGISEASFSDFRDPEFFYQDLDGVIYDAEHKPEKPNMIICASRNDHLPKIAAMGFKFPIYPSGKKHSGKKH